MLSHIRALVAASAFAFVVRGKVAGLYDHTERRHLRIAAEARGHHLQGYDGDRDSRFGGTLPDLVDVGDGTSLHLNVEGTTARGYDRGTASHFTATVTDRLVQVYDHAEAAWFSYGIQLA